MAIERYRGGLSPWSPFRELEEIRERMADLFGSVFPATRHFFPFEGGPWAPPIEVSEDENQYVLKADLPGLNKDDIEVAVSQNVLTIKGERKAEKEQKDQNYYYCERHYGAFQRSVTLPGTVEPDRITASYRNGILEIRLPKAEAEKEKKIDIKVE